MRARVLLLAVQVGVMGMGAVALAAPGFVPVPAPSGKKTDLRMRVVGYEGSSNGELTIEVQNPSAASARFSANGLYFVPAQNANNAPQRLGAAGPFQAHLDHGWNRKEALDVPPGATVKMKLDVYCIDSHRRSPQTGDVFRVARDRMPPALTRSISAGASSAAYGAGGFAAPAAKAAIQSEVWRNRDSKWIKLDGEGRQEIAK